MAIEQFDGFDSYNGVVVETGLQAGWTLSDSTKFSMQTGRFGGQGMRLAADASTVSPWNARRGCVANAAKAVGFATKWASLPVQDSMIVGLFNGTVGQIGLVVTPTGALKVYTFTTSATYGATLAASGKTLLGTSSAPVIVAGVYHFIEIEYLNSVAGGIVNVYVDGTAVTGLQLTGQNTRNQGLTTVDTFQFDKIYGDQYPARDIDDFYVVDAVSTRLGECKVETLRPTADTATKNWTPNTGTVNFSRVNETLYDGDTSYNSASAVGVADLYDMADLSSTPTAILAVQAVLLAKKTDAATRSLYASVKSGATNSDGAAITLAASYTRLNRLMTLDPNGSIAWTAAAVNALQAGPKVAV